jgi:hypothetical protein
MGDADAQPVARPVQRRLGLREHLEQVGELFGGDSDAVVSHPDDRLRRVVLDGQRDAAARIGEFAGVVQQVADDLREPNGIGVEVNGRRRQRVSRGGRRGDTSRLERQ